MDAVRAREHLDTLDEILRQAKRGSPPALQFIVWGLVGMSFDVVGQLVSLNRIPANAFLIAFGVLALAIVVSIWDMQRMRVAAGRQTTIGRLAALSFWSAAAVMTVVTIVNEFTKVFPPFAPAVFFAAGMSVALLT